MKAAVPMVRLQDVADLNPPLDVVLADDDTVSFLPMSAVDAERADAVDNETRRFAEAKKGYTPFKAEDILVAKITPCFENGKIAQAKLTRGIGFGSTEFHVIRARPSELDPRYLVHFLRQERIRKEGERKMTGSAGQRRVPEHFLANLRIPLPSLPEQRRIAEILDKADALRAKRRAALKKLEELSQSIFLDMFGDPATNPRGWPSMPLGELFDICRGGSPRPIDDFLTEDKDGINWVMIGDATESGKYITKTRRRIKPEGARYSRAVRPGDLLLTNSMSFGRPYIMRTTGCIHDGWLVLSPRSELEPEYFYTLLGSRAVFEEFRRRAPGATVKNLNIDLVRSVSVPVAPLEMQAAFGKAVSIIERAMLPIKNSLLQLEQLFSSLQQKAFGGKL